MRSIHSRSSHLESWLQEEEKKGGKKGRLLGIITLSDVLRYIIGDVGIGESLGPSETTTPANQTPATQTPAPQTPAAQDEDKQGMPIPVVNETTPVAEDPPVIAPPSDPPAVDSEAPPPDAP